MPRVALSAVLLGVLATGGISAARAADDGSNDDTAIAKILQNLGLKAPPGSPDITYSERSPLVVPPTRDLPPPVADAPPGADWPKDAARPRKHVKSKSPPPAPAPVATVPAAPASADAGTAAAQPGQAPPGAQPSQPGQAAQPGQAPPGAQPPQPGQAAQGAQPPSPGQTGTVARVPNPTPQPTSWWNPKTWFNREEYANFSTEPPREDLTDPPAGYRTPSPDQPYGVGPEHKKTEATVPNATTGGSAR